LFSESPSICSISRGIYEAKRVGWEKYRRALTETSYADVIERYLKNKNEEIPAENKGMSEFVANNLNIEAMQRASKLGKFLEEQYAKDKNNASFYCRLSDKKLMVFGRRIKLGEDGNPIGKPVTRIYFTPPTFQSPEAFKKLLDSLVDNDVMGDIDLALNMESYQGEFLNKPFENNTIILYVNGENPLVMDKVVKAIERAKTENPDLWRLAPKDEVDAQEQNLASFMIPLDKTTAFVETPDINSYHAGPFGHVYWELTGELPSRSSLSLKDLADIMKSWTPEVPGLFTEQKERRKFMPALVFGEKV
jgi:hypothetical protein